MRTLSALLLALVAAAPLSAQTPPAPAGEELVDRVVAVVGDTVLTHLDILADLQQLQASGRLPTDEAARDRVARQLIQQRVSDLILLEAARAEKVEVGEEEISRVVDEEVRAAQQRVGSEAALRQALASSGMTLEQYREVITSQYRDRALIDRFTQQRLAKAPRPAVTDEEMRRFFEAQSAALGTRPANVSFQQVYVQPQPTDSAKAAARRRAEEVLQELARGGDFEVLARRYSEDPGSKEHGGDLGWFRPGRMVPQFEQVAFAMRPGQTSGVVETPFGFHIIRLEKTRGAERQARHILIRPEVTEADQARARARADSIAAAARAGQPLPDLPLPAGITSDQMEVEHVPLGNLPPAYATAFEGAAVGSVVGPIEVPSPTGAPMYAVARLSGRQEEGTYTLDDLRDQVRERLQRERMVAALVEELRGTMYVRVEL